MKCKRNEAPRSAAGEDILQWLFGTWLDLSDLSTDREPKARNSNIATFRVSVLISLFSFKSFHSPFTSTILRLSTFEAKELMSLENFCFVFTYNLLLLRSIVTFNRCNLTLSPLINVWRTLTFCTVNFNRKLIKFFWGNNFETKRSCLFYFCVEGARVLKLAPY